jgi:hypothetical protein
MPGAMLEVSAGTIPVGSVWPNMAVTFWTAHWLSAQGQGILD